MKSFRIVNPSEARNAYLMATLIHAQASDPQKQRPPDRFTRLNGEKITTTDALERFFQGGSFHYQIPGHDNPIRLCITKQTLEYLKDWVGDGAAIIVRRAW
jgi:hypothetical protein